MCYQPRIDDHNPLSCGSDLPRNMLLRFCSSTWWFIILEVGQLLIQHFRSYLACVGLETEPKGAAFVDLCTVAKVSVLLLDDNYHGYLLYCDSSAESADTSLRSLTRQILVEMKVRERSATIPRMYTSRFFLFQALFTTSFFLFLFITCCAYDATFYPPPLSTNRAWSRRGGGPLTWPTGRASTTRRLLSSTSATGGCAGTAHCATASTL